MADKAAPQALPWRSVYFRFVDQSILSIYYRFVVMQAIRCLRIFRFNLKIGLDFVSSVQCGGQKAGTRSSLMVRNTEESGASLSLVRQRVSRLIRERETLLSRSVL